MSCCNHDCAQEIKTDLRIERTQRGDGGCGACRCNEHGHPPMARGPIFAIVAGGASNGTHTMRLCDDHMEEAFKQWKAQR